jgi:hypothetical protein
VRGEHTREDSAAHIGWQVTAMAWDDQHRMCNAEAQAAEKMVTQGS